MQTEIEKTLCKQIEAQERAITKLIKERDDYKDRWENKLIERLAREKVRWESVAYSMQQKVKELTKVMEAARDDLLMRGDIDSKGCRVVNMSATTWDNFCNAIDKAALSQESE